MVLHFGNSDAPDRGMFENPRFWRTSFVVVYNVNQEKNVSLNVQAETEAHILIKDGQSLESKDH